jgi:hypothetical protein
MITPMKYRKNHYYNYQELTDFINYYSEAFPDYLQFSSIGLTGQKRNIWVVSLTNFKTGPSDEKPAFLLDANMHSGEITGTQVCIYAIHTILNEIKTNKEFQTLLDRVCIQIIPRICPDAAEHYLNTDEEVRSSMESWPAPRPLNQFCPHDLDNNNMILQMRKRDSSGAFKTSSKNKALMVQRQLDDFDTQEDNSEFYSLFPEGYFLDQDKTANDFFKTNYTAQRGIDLNRQFPSNYRPEGEQMGAGPYSGYVLEARSLIEFITSQPRIFAQLNLHTYGGLVLKTPSAYPDEKVLPHDLIVLNQLKNKAAEVSGYYAVDIYKDFRYTERDVSTGTLADWTFEHRGIYSSVIEIWDVWKAAGISKVNDHVARYFWPKEADLFKIFSWAKKNFPKKYFYADWKKFKHPQLGDIEIGGWKKSRIFRNPPEKLLENECEKVFKIILSQVKITPVIKLKSKKIKRVSKDTTLVSLVYQNSGYLPTHGSEQAIKSGAVKKPLIHLQLDKNQKLIQGDKQFEVDHLSGRTRFLPWHTPLGFVARSNTHEVQVQWLIQGSGTVNIRADFQRGGVNKIKLKI